MYLNNTLKPRDYQKEIATSASKSNTLVILPTGLGKTIIAILVTTSRLNYKNGKILILAPTRPLVLQHYSTFQKFLTLDNSQYTMVTGTINPEDRKRAYFKSKIIFATPQTVRNDIKSERLSLRDFVLVVFDEAHRCVGDYSYSEIAREYMKQSKKPLILGLTASPGGSKERINKIIGNLFIKKVEARTEEDEDVKKCIEKTKIEWLKIKLSEDYQSIIKNLKELYMERVNKLRNLGLIPKERLSKKILLESRSSIIERLNKMDRNNYKKTSIYASFIYQAQAIVILHAIELMETQGVSTTLKYLLRLKNKPEHGRAVKALLNDERWQKIEGDVKKIEGVIYPKLERLPQIIKNQLNKKIDSKIIIFTQYRDTIDAIIPILLKDGFKAQRFVGQTDRLEDEGMNQKVQKQILEAFRENKFNILVSSSLGEEGLDIPNVDMVIFFEAVPSEIRSIQRKGRTGRTMPGKVLILLAEDTVDESYFYSCIKKEGKMKKIISQKLQKESEKKNERDDKKMKPSTLLDFLN